MAATLAEKLVAAEKLTLAGTDAFPVLATPGGTPSPGMSRFNTLGKMMAQGVIPFAAGSLSVSQPFAVTQTWITAANTYTGIRLNVTDTASTSASLLMDLQVGGSTKFSVSKDGTLNLGAVGYNIALRSGVAISLYLATVVSLDVQAASVGLRSLQYLGWSSTDDASGTADVRLWREAAGVLALRNLAVPQALQVYNTYTNATNYERGDIEWVANVLRIGATALGTGTLRGTLIRGALISFAFGATPTTAWNITTGGHLHAQTDNLYDIGGSTTTLRPRHLYMSGLGYFGSTLQVIAGTGLGIAPTATAWVTTGASTTTRSNINLPATGVAPTTPVNGDIWFDGTALKIQIGGATKTFTVT